MRMRMSPRGGEGREYLKVFWGPFFQQNARRRHSDCPDATEL